MAREERAELSVMTALAFGVVIIFGGLGTFMNFGDGGGKCQGTPLKKFKYGGSVTRYSVKATGSRLGASESIFHRNSRLELDRTSVPGALVIWPGAVCMYCSMLYRASLFRRCK